MTGQARQARSSTANAVGTIRRRQDQIDAEAARDGSCVLHTPVPASELDAPAVLTAYKNLTAQDRVLVPEYQELGVLGHLMPRQHRQAAYEQVDSEMITQRRSQPRSPSKAHA